MNVEWVRRTPALAPRGAVAQGEVAVALAARLRQGCDGLHGVAGERLLVIVGEPDVLPWVDGLVYIAPDPHTPRVWTDIHSKPSIPTPWLASRLPAGRWLVWRESMVALDEAGPIDLARLPPWD